MARAIVDIGGSVWVEFERYVVLVFLLVVDTVVRVFRGTNWQARFLRAHAPQQMSKFRIEVVQEKVLLGADCF